MPRLAAGLLMYRIKNGVLQVLLAHPGGPYFVARVPPKIGRPSVVARVGIESYRGYSCPSDPMAVPEEIITFSTMPGENCESAVFGFRNAGGYSWQAFCKTAYTAGERSGFPAMSPFCHLSVIAMLDHAQELGLLRWVNDEGDYWERRDWLELLLQVRSRAAVPDDLQTVGKQLLDWFGPE